MSDNINNTPENPINNRELSEDTIIKIKPVHLYTFLSVFIGILVAVIGFFYAMLNKQDSVLDEKIKQKVNKEIYNLDKKYTNDGIEDLKEMTETTLNTVKNINEDVMQIKVKVGIMEHHHNNNNNSNAPSQPNLGN
jgi:uncharacterized membrane protein YgaE (UPF0421/DUF939 family)